MNIPPGSRLDWVSPVDVLFFSEMNFALSGALHSATVTTSQDLPRYNFESQIFWFVCKLKGQTQWQNRLACELLHPVLNPLPPEVY